MIPSPSSETPPGAEAPDGGSNSLRQWTRTQRIRTAAALPFQVALVDTSERPVYQRIAAKALQLRELGLSDRMIAGRLEVTDKTVAKAIQWLRGHAPSPRPGPVIDDPLSE
jgi:hypothetical protein